MYPPAEPADRSSRYLPLATTEDLGLETVRIALASVISTKTPPPSSRDSVIVSAPDRPVAENPRGASAGFTTKACETIAPAFPGAINSLGIKTSLLNLKS
jgi:NaMN:DMB phosphoribosyltransferase